MLSGTSLKMYDPLRKSILHSRRQKPCVSRMSSWLKPAHQSLYSWDTVWVQVSSQGQAFFSLQRSAYGLSLEI